MTIHFVITDFTIGSREMRRKGFGIGAIQKDKKEQELYQQKGASFAKEDLEKLTNQIGDFKVNLEKFAAKHKNEIKRNGEFRRHFQQMCAVTGVDPLRSSANFWTKLLGVGDLYYELAVQIVEIFLSTSSSNGGVMSIEELHSRVIASRGGDPITKEDILEAIKKLKVLGNNIREVQTDNSFVIHATPAELNADHIDISRLAHSSRGHISQSQVMDKLGWTEERTRKALDELIMEGMVWVDNQSPERETLHWFPGIKS